jgi:hypothetical protein
MIRGPTQSKQYTINEKWSKGNSNADRGAWPQRPTSLLLRWASAPLIAWVVAYLTSVICKSNLVIDIQSMLTLSIVWVKEWERYTISSHCLQVCRFAKVSIYSQCQLCQIGIHPFIHQNHSYNLHLQSSTLRCNLSMVNRGPRKIKVSGMLRLTCCMTIYNQTCTHSSVYSAKHNVKCTLDNASETSFYFKSICTFLSSIAHT